jgi:flagellum-specific ATP synthase
MPLGPTNGLGPGVPARATGRPLTVPVGPALLGRVLDGLGRPVDGGPSLDHLPRVPIENAAPHAMRRQLITEQMGLGVRALDTLTPVGRGQRIGIMAGSGVGKSTLLSMIARGTTADVVVAALVGERGREVREFLENDLGAEGLARSVVVVATSDEPPVVRLRAAFAATRIAEDFRDQGLDVLLFMDSVTRTAMAQREVGLSAGEPPATRGYPPSAFAMLPRLLERTGPGETGTITGIYTVLVEGDDIQDPIGDTTRSILDGHIVLDRGLANAHHYPAVDVLGSVSRLAGTVTTPEQQRDAATLRRLMAAHREAKLLIDVGAYVPGTDPDVDLARALAPRIDAFLQQTVHEHAGLDDAWARLHELVGGL